MAVLDYRPDAIIGLSDLLALAAYDVGRSLGVVDERTLVAGFNGDMNAVAAVLAGSMVATADIMPDHLGRQLVDLAYAGRPARAAKHAFCLPYTPNHGRKRGRGSRREAGGAGGAAGPVGRHQPGNSSSAGSRS